MSTEISVIICTHNPQRKYLDRVLTALENQELSLQQWELILIDNASDQELASEIDLSWHPSARHVREEQLGLTHARLRGISEAQGKVLAFVDDDNVLNFDYLEVALQISNSFPFLGAWGGQIQPEFEEQPPEWTKPYWSYLAIREFDRDKWSNLPHCYETVPCGAGLCVRAAVAQQFVNLVQSDPKRASLGRKGNKLISCEDYDLAFTSCDLGLGTGQFVDLKLTHLIPKARTQEKYLLQLVEANGYSSPLMESLRGKVLVSSKLSWRAKLRQAYQRWRMHPRERRFYDAWKRGEALAEKVLKIS